MKRKVQKGFTLVELIVVMILMGILMTAVVMILRPSQNTFRNITNKAYEEQTALNISKLLNGSLRYSTGVKVICNDGTTPAAAEINGHKKYIKLINDYRDFSDVDGQAYHKGARGNFERGKVNDDGSLTALTSAVTRASFDDYDFQFSIPEYNSTDAEASMTIAIKAMPMTIGTDEEQQAAADIKKPNPAFVPQWEKFFTYSETFEFINIRNKDTINRKTTGISVDPYEAGSPVTDLGDGTEYFDPRGQKADKSKVDNTIWIFYTNPQEAETKSPGSTGGSGGTPAAPSSGGGEGGSTGGGEGGSTPGVGGSGTGSENNDLKDKEEVDGGEGETNPGSGEGTEGGESGSGSGSENPGGTVSGDSGSTGSGSGDNGENGGKEDDKPAYGTLYLHMLGKTGEGHVYNINLSWVGDDAPKTSGSLNVSEGGSTGSVTITPVYPESVFTVDFTQPGQKLTVTGGYSVDGQYMQGKSEEHKYFYGGNLYADETAAKKARGDNVPETTIQFIASVTLYFIPSNGDKNYNINSTMALEGDFTSDFSEKQGGTIKISGAKSSDNTSAWIGYGGAEVLSTSKYALTGETNQEYWVYKGVKYKSETDALNAKAADEAAAGGGAEGALTPISTPSVSFGSIQTVNYGSLSGITLPVTLTVTEDNCVFENGSFKIKLPEGMGSQIQRYSYNTGSCSGSCEYRVYDLGKVAKYSVSGDVLTVNIQSGDMSDSNASYVRIKKGQTFTFNIDMMNDYPGFDSKYASFTPQVV